MAYKVIDRLFIVVYDTANPSDDEWRTYLEAVRRHGIDRTVQLVITRGGGPTFHQSRYLKEVLCGRSVPVAVISTSVKVRGLSMAMSWFNGKIRVFAPSDLRDAMAYLEIPVGRTELIQHEIDLLHQELGRSRRAVV